MKFCDKIIQNHLLNGGKIKRRDFDLEVGLNKEKRLSYDRSRYYILTQYDLTVDDWEIVEPEYDWDKIIKDKVLCLFWNNDSYNYAIGHLLKVLDNTFHKFVSETYCNNQIRGIHWYQCKPFNPADFNIAKDLKEYEK